MIRIGILGLGYWGPNLARVFSGLDQCRVTAICDRSSERLNRYAKRFPQALATRDSNELLDRNASRQNNTMREARWRPGAICGLACVAHPVVGATRICCT